MNQISVVAAFWVVSVLVSPAWALDCIDPRQPVDQIICNDSSLRSADLKMSKAYFKLIKGIEDLEIRRAIVSSQERWIDVRYRQGVTAPGENITLRKQESDLLLNEIETRMRDLETKNGVPEASPLVSNALYQQRYAKKFSGGPYAGYRTECYFIPTGYGGSDYECFGLKQMQNSARVCSDYTYWASGKYYQYSKVQNISGNELRTVAGCGEKDARCPSPDNEVEGIDAKVIGWNFHVDEQDYGYNPDLSHTQMSAIDPDFRFQDDSPENEPDWMTQCLTDSEFPSRTMQSPSTSK